MEEEDGRPFFRGKQSRVESRISERGHEVPLFVGISFRWKVRNEVKSLGFARVGKREEEERMKGIGDLFFWGRSLTQNGGQCDWRKKEKEHEGIGAHGGLLFRVGRAWYLEIRNPEERGQLVACGLCCDGGQQFFSGKEKTTETREVGDHFRVALGKTVSDHRWKKREKRK